MKMPSENISNNKIIMAIFQKQFRFGNFKQEKITQFPVRHIFDYSGGGGRKPQKLFKNFVEYFTVFISLNITRKNRNKFLR